MTSDAEQLMAEGAARIVAGVDELGAAWVVRAVTDIVDAYGRLDPDTRVASIDAARAVAPVATARVVAALQALFALDPELQRTTPLEIVRSLRREATAVLQSAGVPHVERDVFEVRAFPDDVYGIVPKALGDLCVGHDDELGPALLAWGLGKSRVLRDRKNPGLGVE